MYELTYELKKEDYIDFNLHHAKQSKMIKKKLLLCTIVGVLIILAGGYYTTGGYKDLIGIIVYSIMSILWALFYPKLSYRSLEKNIRKMIEEGKDTSLFDLRQVIIDSKQISEAIIEHESFKKWHKVIKVEMSEQNIFIYTSDVEALVIPKRIIGDEQAYSTFIEEVSRLCKNT